MAEQSQQDTVPVQPPTLEEKSVTLLTERFGEGVRSVTTHRDETTVLLAPNVIVEACQILRDAPGLRYNLLEDVTAVDWPEREPRFDVIYQLVSIETGASLRLKVQVGGEDEPEPEVASVTPAYPAANWFEREVFDLFGIRFTDHPDLSRILMPTDWVGYPLRKDYPLTGFALPDPHWGGQVPLSQSLPEGIGQLTLRTTDGSERPNARMRGEDVIAQMGEGQVEQKDK